MEWLALAMILFFLKMSTWNIENYEKEIEEQKRKDRYWLGFLL